MLNHLCIGDDDWMNDGGGRRGLLFRRYTPSSALGSGNFLVPTVYSDDNGTRVVLTAPTTYAEMNMEERLWNCYMHACSCFFKGGFLTNLSLRDRFGLERNNTNMVRMSNLIAEAKTRNLIKVVDENTSTRICSVLGQIMVLIGCLMDA